MNRRLALQRPVETDDGAGGVSIAWETLAEVWAALEPRSGSEGLWAHAPAGRLKSEIVIRHRADVWPQMRFADGARVWNIHAVFDPDGRRRRLVCLCEEKPL